MSSDLSTTLDPELQLDEIVAAYLESLEAGDAADPSAWIARYPQFAEELARFFADQERFDCMLQPLASTSIHPEDNLDTPPHFTTSATSHGGLTPRRSPDPGTGQRFGDYELLEEIARGGMGVVFKARHLSLQRIVAVKMILSGQWARPEEVQRFRLEAEAVARLDHPHIVPIYEVGEHEGWQFYSMKYIEGGNLAGRQWSRPLARAGQIELSLLLAGVAEAIHHAHERGILHRDLKPANILLDQQGQPHVADFGLAKRFETAGRTDLNPSHGRTDLNPSHDMATPSGTAVGTPSYMAPEQALSPRNATVAADIYSLGCILYELLTGRPPFRAETPLATLLDVLERNPDRPRTIDPGLDRDLEIICLKCLEKEPGKRYASAAALADDLRHFAAGEPIQARPTGRIERLVRWCKRQPLLTGLLTVLVLVVAGAFGLITWQWLRAEHHFQVGQKHLETAQLEKAEADHQRQLAEERAQLAHRLVEEFCLRLSEDELQSVPGTHPLRKKLLVACVQYYRQFVKENAGDPALRINLAKAYYALGTVLSAIGSRQESLQEFQLALDLFEELQKEDSTNVSLASSCAQTLNFIAVQQADTSQWKAALDSYERSRAMYASLVEKQPGNIGFRSDLAGVHMNTGNLHRVRRDFDKARASYDQSLAIKKKLVETHPRNASLKASLAKAYFNYAGLLSDLGNDECMEFYRLSRTLNQQLVHDYPQNVSYQRELAQSLRTMGERQRIAGTLEDALKTLDASREILDKLQRSNPQVVQYQSDLAATLWQSGMVYFKQSKWDQAGPCFQKAGDLLEKAVVLQPDLPSVKSDLGKNLDDLGVVQGRQGKQVDALRSFRRACDVRNELIRACPELLGYRHELASTLGNVGVTLRNLNRKEDAVAAFAEAVANDRQVFDGDPTVPLHRRKLSDHLSLLADTQRRCQCFDQAIENTLARAKLWPADGECLYLAARDLGQIAADIDKNSAAAPETYSEMSKQAGDAAVALLQQAVKNTFRDWQRLEKESAFAPLKEREDFREIVAGLKAGN